MSTTPRTSTAGDETAPLPVEIDEPKTDFVSKRLTSLDAYRGFIMIVLAGSGFGIAAVAGQFSDSETWQRLAFHFQHPEWISRFAVEPLQGFGPAARIGVSFWDLIQPAFMFMVGVAMPFSYARRQRDGQSRSQRTAHVLIRALVLVALGVLLSSQGRAQTNFLFTNVLAQIGLAYPFVYLLMRRRFAVQLAAGAAILVGYGYWFYQHPVPEPGDEYAAVGVDEDLVMSGPFAHWNKNVNAAADFDRWFLNLFPRAETFEYHPGGYQTLNFVPSIVTMLLGVMCAQWIRSGRRRWVTLLLLIAGGAVCLGLGVAAGETVCPVVKRIWTPSWALFSGGWVIWMLAAFYLLFDLLPLKPLAFPLIVVGMNSLLMYIMGQTLKGWTAGTLQTHLGQDIFGGPYGPIVQAASVLAVFWLICLWLYRQRIFIRV